MRFALALTDLNEQDAHVYEMAMDVTNEHAADGCCSPDQPCDIVKIHYRAAARLEAGHSFATAVEAEPGRRPAGGSAGANQYGTYQVRMPSDKQVRFIVRLLADKPMPSTSAWQGIPRRALDAFLDKKANLRQATDLISWLLDQPDRPDVAARRAAGLSDNPASDKQVGFVTRLAAERDWQAAPTHDINVRTIQQVVLHSAKVDKRDATSAINWLLSLNRVACAPDLEAGIYLLDGVVHKIQRAVHGSGRMYAKALDPTTCRFEFAPGSINKIKPDHRMSLDQAKLYGAIYGVCCNCGATLTDERSIEAGIGPVCAKKFR